MQATISIQQYQPRFNVDPKDLNKPNVLQDMIKYNKEVVKFRLQCALDAYDAEGSLRYLRNPTMYCQCVTQTEVKTFLDLFRQNLSESVNKLIRLIRRHSGRAEWAANFVANEALRGVFASLLHFTIMSCKMKLVDYSHRMTSPVQLFVTECDVDKENEFNRLPGSVTYLFHRTGKHCLYSICRNGIKSMSNIPGFQTTGASYGAGIYMSLPGQQVHPVQCTLCFAVKNAARRHVSSGIYVTQEEDPNSGYGCTLDHKVIECIDTYFNSKK